jgi:hypothetical protein
MSHLDETPVDTFWRFLWVLAKIVFVLIILAAILWTWVVWRIRESIPEMQAVPAPVAWVTRQVVLTAEDPVVRGRLVLTSTTVPIGDLRFGVTAGAPESDAPSSPGALLTGPSVLITTDLAFVEGGCYAPCELELRPTWDCQPSGCRLEASLDVELADTAGEAGRVTFGLSGGITAGLVDGLPPGLGATIELDGDAAPGAT